MKTDPRIDAYIEKSAEFARPVLIHLRKLVHEACPEVEETMKWSFPHFDYKGMMCSMAAFKSHCSFNFWKASLMEDSAKLAALRATGGMGVFGKISSVEQLPDDATLRAYVREACRLNDEDVRLPLKPKSAPTELIVPEDLAEALAANDAAAVVFDGFPYSARKEYVEWITEAKTEATRAKRLATAVGWIAEGKRRNWKYEKC